MTKIVRVVAEWVEEPEEDRITFDVFIDDDGAALSKVVTFGFMGSLKQNAIRFLPFAIRPNGQLANGSDSGEPDNTKEYLNPFGKTMRAGEYITFTEEDDEHTYKIIKVLDLIEEHG